MARLAAAVLAVAALVMIVAGAVTWGVVTSQLKAEQITVAKDAAPVFGMKVAGKQVAGPVTAWGQAEIIKHHALEAAGGKTYAELPQNDPKRTVVMNGAFLRTSLFASVIVYGIAALVIGLGILNLVLAAGLNSLAGSVSAARRE